MSVGDVNGLTVLLTRAREDAEAWAVDLAERGARAVIFPCIEAVSYTHLRAHET